MKINIRVVVGDNIRCLRYKAKLSQEALGEKSGLHQDYIGRLERGKENISIDNLAVIASVFKVHPSSLLIERFCNGNVMVDGQKTTSKHNNKSNSK